MQRVTIQSELSALADFILSHKNEIINRFIEEVDLNPDIHPKGGLTYTYKQLVGHLPMIIEALSTVLQREQGDEMKLGENGASAIHGYIRWQQGFKLDELIGELSILGRLVLVDYLAMFAQRNPGFSGQAETIVRKIITILFANIMLSSVRQYVEESNLILQRTNEELRRVDESRLLFTRTVAHELTNLLNGIQGPVQLLEMSLDEATRQKMISMMRRNATDMKMLLQQLLDYSAMLAGHEQIQEASFEPQSLLDELISTFLKVTGASVENPRQPL
jgi:signal transduction histidine kinase